MILAVWPSTLGGGGLGSFGLGRAGALVGKKMYFAGFAGFRVRGLPKRV